MKVITARNVHAALPIALNLLDRYGIRRETRNGPVLQAPWPVTTVYERPIERVLFWSARDANPFFHLYESLWMLAGRNDLEPLLRYVKTFGMFSDGGGILHGAYGFRWRRHWDIDQLAIIAKMLQRNPEERRAVLQMWDVEFDLGKSSKDIPCNDIATFQRGPEGELNLVVFCRSNDIVLGCYGANAVHFSMLLEYMALWVGCAVGTYTQVSVNWHGYLDTLKKVEVLKPAKTYAEPRPYPTPYQLGFASVVPMVGDIKRIDELIGILLDDADSGFPDRMGGPEEDWASVVYRMLFAHQIYREKGNDPQAGLDILNDDWKENVDWIVAGREWFQRRKKAKEEKNG